MYALSYTNQFKKSVKLCKKRGLDLKLLHTSIDLLQKNGSLPEQYGTHKLSGKYLGCMECYIKPDWLLVWKQNDLELILLLVDTGSHSDLF